MDAVPLAGAERTNTTSPRRRRLIAHARARTNQPTAGTWFDPRGDVGAGALGSPYRWNGLTWADPDDENATYVNAIIAIAMIVILILIITTGVGRSRRRERDVGLASASGRERSIRVDSTQLGGGV